MEISKGAFKVKSSVYYRLVVLVVLLGLNFLSSSRTQAQNTDYRIHGMFLANFAKYVVWPTTGATFTMAVMGPEDVVASVNNMVKGKTVNSAAINVVKINSVNEISTNFNMVFLPNMASGKFEEVKAVIGNKPILLVTEKAGLGKAGSMINFVELNGKMRFELNEPALNENNLKVMKNLVVLSIKV